MIDSGMIFIRHIVRTLLLWCLVISPAGAEPRLQEQSLPDLEQRIGEIDVQLTKLSHFTLRGGVGAIGDLEVEVIEPQSLGWARVVGVARGVGPGPVVDDRQAAKSVLAIVNQGHFGAVVRFPDFDGDIKCAQTWLFLYFCVIGVYQVFYHRIWFQPQIDHV